MDTSLHQQFSHAETKNSTFKLISDLKFKHWSADGHSSMTLEAALDHIKDSFSDCHLEGVIVPCALSLKYMHCVNQ